LRDDLARRDFTINALAMRLGIENLGDGATLTDPYGGQSDITAHLIRVLHELSFQDDATRMLRAVRYAARLGFAIEHRTASWLERDLSYLDTISGPRLRRELVLIFEEATGLDAAAMASDLGILAAIHPALSLNDAVAIRWRAAFAGPNVALRDETGFCILAANADDDAVTSLSDRLHLKGRYEDALRDAVRLRSGSSKLAAMRHDPVAAVETMQHAAPSAVWATGIVAGGDIQATCESYLREWRHVKPLLRGDYVITLGVQPGVAVGDALRELRNARLRGEVTSRIDEEALVRAMLEKTDR
jgi:tRNA nucleotidyltransferase (CCA-adding enzyme)